MMLPPIPPQSPNPLDSPGAGEPVVAMPSGRLPAGEALSPFSPTEYARLLVLRRHVRAGLIDAGDLGCVGAAPPAERPRVRGVHSYAPSSRGWSEAIVVGAPVLAGAVLATLAHLLMLPSV
jgi:hypothetical protein